MKKLILIVFVAICSLQVSAQIFGPFYGVNLYVNKSNLFNSDDLRADSFQSYKMTSSFAGNFEYGYLYESGFSVATGIQFGSCNQSYKGSYNSYTQDLTASTKMSFIKIPVIFGIQKNNDKKMKFLYTVGLFYSYNTKYSDTWEYTDKVAILGVTHKDTYTLTDDVLTYSNNTNSTLNSSYSLSKRPYQRHGFGTSASIGFRYQMKGKMEFIGQLKGEFTLTNAETTEETRFTPVKAPTNTFGYSGHAFSNYAKYMFDPNSNWNRASTHPFNLGISLGIRYYLFDF